MATKNPNSIRALSKMYSVTINEDSGFTLPTTTLHKAPYKMYVFRGIVLETYTYIVLTDSTTFILVSPDNAKKYFTLVSPAGPPPNSLVHTDAQKPFDICLTR